MSHEDPSRGSTPIDGFPRILKHEQLTDAIIGVFFDVYNELGYGFLEAVYKQAMCIGLADAGLRAEPDAPVEVRFRGNSIRTYFRDIVVEGKVVLELKTAEAIDPAHQKQLLNYLRATDLEVGLILNFGPKEAEFKRLAFDNERKNPRKSVHPRESAARVQSSDVAGSQS